MRTGRSLVGLLSAVGVIAFAALAMFSRPRPVSGGKWAFAAVPAHAAPKDSANDATRPAQETEKKPTAGDAYMNVQVLKDIPSDQLIPAMRYITVALGVECNFCHDPKSFDNDDKPEKGTARNMMKMMFAINKDNFNGRRQVTCYTCHHGASRAANMPTANAVASPAGVAMPAASGTPPAQPSGAAGNAATSATAMPTVDDIVAKYTEALGGAAAIQKITAVEKRGTVEFANGTKAPAEIWRKAPNKSVTIIHLPNGATFTQGYNGSSAWEQRPGHAADDVTGDDLVRAKQAASLIPGLNLKQDFSRAQVSGTDKIGDREAYRVIAFRSSGGQVRFYFDTQSGLLLRVSERIESPLGALPQDADFPDYRDVNGVKMPFTVIVAHADGPTTSKWDQIQANMPVDDAKFEKPVAKPTQP